MNPILLGIALGVVNVIANAVLMGTVGPEPRGAVMVLVYGILPGVCAGSILGALAGGTRNQSRFARLVILGVPSALVVLCLGAAFKLEAFVPWSLAPTLLCCFILEASSRAKTQPDGTGLGYTLRAGLAGEGAPAVVDKPRSAVLLAMGIGAVVMLVVMIGVEATTMRPGWHGFAHAYVPWGFLVALGLAAPFGVLADYTREWRVWPRRSVLLACAFALTAFLATLFQLDELIFIAFVPVAAGCLALERYSRPAPVMPFAVAR